MIIEVGLENDIVGDEVRDDVGLGDEAVEGEEVEVARLVDEGHACCYYGGVHEVDGVGGKGHLGD